MSSAGSDTRETPWMLETPPGSSELEAFPDGALGLAEVEHNPRTERMRAAG